MGAFVVSATLGGMSSTHQAQTRPASEELTFTSSRGATAPSPELPPPPAYTDLSNPVHRTLTKTTTLRGKVGLTKTEQRYPCPECIRDFGKTSRVGNNRRTCGTCNRFYQAYRRTLTRMALALLTPEELEMLDEGAREVTYKQKFPEYKARYNS